MTHDDLLDIMDTLDAIRDKLIEQPSLSLACSHLDDAIAAISDHLDAELNEDDDEDESL